MSTSDQNGHGQLTRKQLREIRLTGSTPVITGEEPAAAAQPSTVLPRAAEPVEIAPVPDVEVTESDAPLTRRQMRALEHLRAAGEEQAGDSAAEPQAVDAPDAEPAHAVVESEAPVVEPEPVVEIAHPLADESVAQRQPVEPASRPVEPQSSDELVSAVPVFDAGTDRDQVAEIFEGPSDEASPDHAVTPDAEAAGSDAEHTSDEVEVVTAERPVVGAAFGLGVKPEKPAGALFDDLLEGGSSSGSQHSASTALIFTPSSGAGSLSGPIASTGELLITGTYALPDGIGSHGHAHGTTDGRDADAVLLDGELAPASSPTPIAASSAVSTSKSAGEVIRPPAPDKGNKLMLTLAIVAGGLALALAATLIIASTTGVFG
ncbi:hypothetical protein ACU045_11275 [Microbacterium sp. MAHUQ-60]|uniref:hypothetical protein n=1 Tax=unclassified Microbacterium TaxID=2609290 RepID=UPI0036175D6A